MFALNSEEQDSVVGFFFVCFLFDFFFKNSKLKPFFL